MIEQGTDGQSQGVWATPLHAHLTQTEINAAVFAPLAFDYCFTQWLLATHLPGAHPTRWRYQSWEATSDMQALFDQLTIWYPPPEMARQAITFMLNAWIERPTTTAAMFIIPRILQHQWQGLSQHLQEVATYHPRELPLDQQPLLPIPLTILYLGPHVRTLPDPHRMDMPALPFKVRWHWEQARLLCRLPPYDLEASQVSHMCLPQP